MGILKSITRYIVHYFFISAVVTLSLSVLAEEMDEVNTEALNKTIELLNSKSQREGVINDSKEAQKADRMAQDLMGNSENMDELYQAAGEIFRKLANDSNGDLQKMMRSLQEAQKNPEQFYNNMTDEQKAMIKNLGEKANDQRKLDSNQ